MNTIDEDEIAKFTAMADEWWDEGGKFKPLHRINPLRIGYIRDHAVAHFSVAAGQQQPLSGLSLLDVGSGGGLLCEPLTRLGAQVTGIDAGEKNIQVATLHAEQSGIAIDYQHSTAEAFAEQGQQFDVVTALEIIEHVANPQLFVQSVMQLVKPGGMAFFSTLNRTPKAYALAIIGAEYVLRWLPRGTHDWKKFVRPSELIGWVEHGHATHVESTGMVMHPLTFEWRLDGRDISVNYVAVFRKDIA